MAMSAHREITAILSYIFIVMGMYASIVSSLIGLRSIPILSWLESGRMSLFESMYRSIAQF